ncbi:MAG: glycoside hydrolase family 3 C-terminal domain-containing protein [Clostridia bacterium]|nr:glycoside hydrolase family 3 C-terminal domain-containing protein [Clostridia bacterium]
MIRKLWNGLANLFAFLLVLSIVAGNVLEANRAQVDIFFGTQSSETIWVEDPVEEGEEEEEETGLKNLNQYSTFLPNEEYLNADGTGNSRALIKDAIDIGRRHNSEGSVLLKNNGALPLAKGANTKVTLLGTYAYNTIVNSSMGQKSQGGIISLRNALGGTATDFATENVGANASGADFQFADLKLNGNGVAAGAGFTVNPNFTGNYSGVGQNKGASNTYTVGEKDPSTLTAEFTGSFRNYNDAAIVVLGRGSGESNDYLKGGLNNNEKAEGITEPLELTPNEIALLDLAKDNFDKVIVLLNTNSAIEVGDLKYDNEIDAILWIGHPGNYGTLGVADILCGNVSPSGGLYDIYATYNLSTPAMQNMGKYNFVNGSEITRSKSKTYVMENESIYVGYRYYETRYYDAIYNQGGAKSTVGTFASNGAWDYAAEVAYGFGYGMSYTTFDYKMYGNITFETPSEHEIYAKVQVEVTNTGDVAGRTPVQIYGQAPYTQYDKDHLVEKAAIQLLGFDKTDIIQPGESEVVAVKIDMQNFASYDNTYKNPDNTYGSYILDAGNYYFAVGNGAHDALNNVLALQGKKVADGMDYEGKADAARLWNYEYTENNGVDATTFGVAKTGEQIENQIPYIDWNFFSGTKIPHLTRNDWEGTYPEADYALTAPADMIEYLDGAIPVGEGAKGEFYTIKTNDNVSNIKWDDTTTNITYTQMGFASWDDPRWDSLLNQLNLAEATTFASLAGPSFTALTGAGFVADKGGLTDNAGNGIVFKLNAGKDKNQPWAVTTGEDANWNGQVFGSAPLVASSFDRDLMYQIGDFVGNEAIFLGLPIVWGPGLNTHRHAYNGRNGEYYSEDPVLAGYCALDFAVAARRKGLIASPKHFVFNDQESNRQGVAPFMTEQRAREIELRAYQICMEAVDYDGYGMIGLMTSFSKVGPTEVTNSWGMLTGILQEEWGFTGYAVTDISDDKDLYTGMVYAGCTGYDLRFGQPTSTSDFASKIGGQAQTVTGKITLSTDMFAGDATMQQIIRRSIKRSLWCFAQSNLMNRSAVTIDVANDPTGDTGRPDVDYVPGHNETIEHEVIWRVMYKSAIGVTAGLAGVAALLYVASCFKKKEVK